MASMSTDAVSVCTQLSDIEPISTFTRWQNSSPELCLWMDEQSIHSILFAHSFFFLLQNTGCSGILKVEAIFACDSP
jgi:hypothetical protein